MRIDVRKVHRLAASAVTTGDAGFSTIHEPSVAVANDQALLAGNWYAARSTDRFLTWEALDPYAYLIPGPETRFCCDQTVHFDAAHNLIIWLLQMWNDSTYVAPDPGGSKWLMRCSDRITTGWLADGVLGWMWTSGSLGTQRPFPFVRVVTVAPETATVISESDIWSPDFAYAYPSACPNDEGVVGVTLFRGGGTKQLGHVVGALDPASGGWVLTTPVEGTHGPHDHKWGDYLTCQSAGEGWIACGYTLQGGATLENLVVDLVEFGVV